MSVALSVSYFSLNLDVMRLKPTILFSLFLLIGTTACHEFYEIVDELKPQPPKVSDVASGLAFPLGVDVDDDGQLWITESGTGLTNDGEVSLITKDGKLYPVVQGFSSFTSEGAVVGLNHLILKDGILWILHGIEGRLYKLNVSAYRPGDAPLQAKDLEFEDIGTFVKNYNFEEDTNETNIYNITVGPDGDFYITDAAANAIIRRHASSGELNIFAVVPAIPNPGNPDFPTVQSVPTGIAFDGDKFLVSTFTGYPFPRQATIFEFDLQGNATKYQGGLSNLTDLALGTDHHPVVVEYSTFSAQGFAPNAGRLVFSSRQKNVSVLTGLNFPTSIERSGLKTYYITYPVDGKIQKVVF